jgi:hypothetical protein
MLTASCHIGSDLLTHGFLNPGSLVIRSAADGGCGRSLRDLGAALEWQAAWKPRPVRGRCRWPADHPAQLAWAGLFRALDPGRSAPFFGVDGARSNFVFVSGKGCQDFSLFALRDLGEIKTPSELRGDLIEFCRRDPEVPVRLL